MSWKVRLISYVVGELIREGQAIICASSWKFTQISTGSDEEKAESKQSRTMEWQRKERGSGRRQDKHQLNAHNDNVVPKSHLEPTKLQLPLYMAGKAEPQFQNPPTPSPSSLPHLTLEATSTSPKCRDSRGS